MALLADLRAKYLKTICAELLGYRKDSPAPSIADKHSRISTEIAEKLVETLGHPLCQDVPPPQAAGNEFTRITMEFLKEAFHKLDHVRPGSWEFDMDPSRAKISRFDQYGHLADLSRVLSEHKDLATTIGSDYLVTPDIVVRREAVEEFELNRERPITDPGDGAARRSPLRAFNEALPTLHASISCKFTMRSDRSQNTRTEALNLIRHRKGRNPHIVAVTMEPRPGIISSIAMGTGDVDCTYHAALDELLQATVDLGLDDSEEVLQTMIEGRRLRDISDLPLDLAT